MNAFSIAYRNLCAWFRRRRLRCITFTPQPTRVSDTDIHFLLDVIKILLGLIGLLSLWIMFVLNDQELDRLHPTPHQPVRSEQTSLPFL